MAIGSAIGGVLGGIIGAIPSFGIAAAPAAAAGSALGGLVEGGVRWSQAQKQQIDPTDIRQKILLDEIIRKRKMMEAGTMYSPQQEAIQQMGTMAANRAMRASGGNIGATIQALSNIQRGTGRSLNELYGNMMGQSVNMLGLQNQLTQEMANRVLGLQMYNKQQAMVHGANTLQSGLENIMALIASRGGSIDDAISGLSNRATGSTPTLAGGGNVNNEILRQWAMMQNPTLGSGVGLSGRDVIPQPINAASLLIGRGQQPMLPMQQMLPEIPLGVGAY